MRRSKLLFLGFIISMVFFFACKKEYFDMDKMRQDQWLNVNMQVPVVKTSLVLRDVLRDYDHEKLFEVDNEGFLSLIYHRTVYSSYAKDFIILPTQSFPAETFTDTDVNGGATINRVLPSFGSFTGAQLDSIKYDTLEISVSVSNNFSTTGGLTIQFPELPKNGTMAQMLISDLNNTTTQEFYGYELDLTDGGTSNNTIKYNYIFDSQWNGNSGENVNITISLTKNDYKIINGFIGQHDIPLPEDSVHIDIFDKEFEGQFYFKDPKIQLNMVNSYGLPIRLVLDTIYGSDFEFNQSPDYDLGINMNPVNYPNIKGDYAKDSILIDTVSFPEIRDLISYKPRYLHFDGESYANPQAAVINNFVIDTSRFDLNMKFILPLWGRAEYPQLTDTSDFDVEKEFEKLDDLDYFKIKLFANNGLPAQVNVQAYFIDSLGVIQDSLFYSQSEQFIIEGGFTDNQGKVIQKRSKLTEIVYPRDRIEKMKTVKKVVYVAIISTDDIEHLKNVKFYASDAIDLKMGIHVKGGTDLDFEEYSDTTSSN
jgi:hypothetical protein